MAMIQKISKNSVEVEVKRGLCVLFSYETVVAVRLSEPLVSGGAVAYRTEKRWSKTTEAHISGWIIGIGFRDSAVKIPQERLERLAAGDFASLSAPKEKKPCKRCAGTGEEPGAPCGVEDGIPLCEGCDGKGVK